MLQTKTGWKLSDQFESLIGLTTSLCVVLFATVVSIFIYKRHQHIRNVDDRLAKEREEMLANNGGKSAKNFTGKEIKKATNNFSLDHLLGCGGFGEVYKGILDDVTIILSSVPSLATPSPLIRFSTRLRFLHRATITFLFDSLVVVLILSNPSMAFTVSRDPMFFPGAAASQLPPKCRGPRISPFLCNPTHLSQWCEVKRHSPWWKAQCQGVWFWALLAGWDWSQSHIHMCPRDSGLLGSWIPLKLPTDRQKWCLQFWSSFIGVDHFEEGNWFQ